MRAEGLPSGVAVASATASGSKAPAATASSNQRRKRTSGSRSRSCSVRGRSRGSVTRPPVWRMRSAAAAGGGHRNEDLALQRALAGPAGHLAEGVAAGVEVDLDAVGVADHRALIGLRGPDLAGDGDAGVAPCLRLGVEVGATTLDAARIGLALDGADRAGEGAGGDPLAGVRLDGGGEGGDQLRAGGDAPAPRRAPAQKREP